MMTTWVFHYTGNLRAKSGTSINGTAEVRATDVNDALAKFNQIFTSAPVIRIVSIQGSSS